MAEVPTSEVIADRKSGRDESGPRREAPVETAPSVRDRAEYVLYRMLRVLVRHVPLPLAQSVAKAAARAVFALGGERASYVRRNLEIAFPEASETFRRTIGRASYEHFGLNALELIRTRDWDIASVERRVTFRGADHLQAAMAGGLGAIGLTLHLGNFELGVTALPLLGIEVVAIARTLRNALLYRELVGIRSQRGQVVDRRRAALPMMRAIRDGKLVLVLNDQYVRPSHGAFAPLFGARCSTSTGVATVAVRTGAAIVPMYIVRGGPEQHVITFEPPLDVELTGDRKADTQRITEQCNAALEAIIRRHPDQWMWGHRRFRHSPDLPEEVY